MQKTNKLQDVSLLAEERALLNQILDQLTITNIETKRVEITQLASRALKKAKDYKQAQQGDVAIDRQLKQVRWVCRKSMAKLKCLATDDQKIQRNCWYNHSMGDLGRYMAVAADIPRIDRAPNSAEMNEHTRWVSLAITHYERSQIPLVVYTAAIRKMLYAGAKPLLALMLTLRYYSLQLPQIKPELAEGLACVEDAAIYLRGSLKFNEFLQQLGDFVLSVLAQLRFSSTTSKMGRDQTGSTLPVSLAEQIIRTWNRDEQPSVPPDLAYTAVFALIYLGQLLLHYQHPTFLISGALRSNVLFCAAAEIRFRESEFLLNNSFLSSFWQSSFVQLPANDKTLRAATPINEVFAKLYDYIYVPRPF